MYYHVLSDIFLRVPWKHVFSLSGKFSLCLETILNRLSRDFYRSGHFFKPGIVHKTGSYRLGLEALVSLEFAV